MNLKKVGTWTYCTGLVLVFTSKWVNPWLGLIAMCLGCAFWVADDIRNRRTVFHALADAKKIRAILDRYPLDPDPKNRPPLP